MTKDCKIKLCWVVTIWTKWQIVIPKEVRESLQLEAWDTLSVIVTWEKYIWLIRNNDLWDLKEYIDSQI